MNNQQKIEQPPHKVAFKETNGWIKLLLSSGPIAWLLLGFGIIQWGLKLEARFEASEKAAELRISRLEAEHAAMHKDYAALGLAITRIEERHRMEDK